MGSKLSVGGQWIPSISKEAGGAYPGLGIRGYGQPHGYGQPPTRGRRCRVQSQILVAMLSYLTLEVARAKITGAGYPHLHGTCASRLTRLR